MKYWTILIALLIAVFGVGHAEETADDFREVALEDVYSDAEDDEQLEKALAIVDAASLDEEDKPEVFKRSPLWGRRRRRRRNGDSGGGSSSSGRRRGGWFRRLLRKVHMGAKKACGILKVIPSQTIKFACRFVNYGDEELPHISDKERFISPEEAHELLKQPGWVFRQDDE